VDLLVLSVSAPQAAEALIETAEQHLAESVVLIPGGLDENPDARLLVADMRDALARARSTAWGGPVVNGGNCLGVRSRPGRFDTLFIPETKLPRPAGDADPIALVTGSGAFAVSKISKLPDVQPLYTITIATRWTSPWPTTSSTCARTRASRWWPSTWRASARRTARVSWSTSKASCARAVP
jgi:hypothetical protein